MDSAQFCFIVIVLVLAVPLGLLIWRRRSRDEQAQAAYRAYQDALAELRRHPSDPARRARALDLGRQLGAASRESKSATVYDEMAIMNDINAATASVSTPAPSPGPAPAPSAPPATSVESRLRALDGLRDKGLVTEDEYAERRRRILDEM